MLELLFPVVAKAAVSGTAFCLRNIMLEKLRLRDQNIIQSNDIKGFHAEKDDKEASQELPKSKPVLQAFAIFLNSPCCNAYLLLPTIMILSFARDKATFNLLGSAKNLNVPDVRVTPKITISASLP